MLLFVIVALLIALIPASREGAGVSRARAWPVRAAGGAALFHMYAAGVSPFTALVQRPVHLALMGVVGFLLLGRRRRAEAEVE